MVWLYFGGSPFLGRILLMILHIFPCRRAMVHKFWCQDITRKWFHRKLEPPHARVFSEPHFRSHVAGWYLLYRWMMFLLWVSIIVCSVFEFGSYKPHLSYKTWPIYLTNWDLVLGTSQALLGAFLISFRWKMQKIPGFDPSSLQFGLTERFYWFLFVTTTNIAIGVTVTYWIGVYDPKLHSIDPLNVLIHICNSILMLLDFYLTGIPFRLRNFWWCLTIVTCYVAFTVIYYAAGGLNRDGFHYIYKILDWSKPLRTSLVCVGGITFLIVMHSLLCLVATLKGRCYGKGTKDLGKSEEGNDRPAAAKQVNIV